MNEYIQLVMTVPSRQGLDEVAYATTREAFMTMDINTRIQVHMGLVARVAEQIPFEHQSFFDDLSKLQEIIQFNGASIEPTSLWKKAYLGGSTVFEFSCLPATNEQVAAIHQGDEQCDILEN